MQMREIGGALAWESVDLVALQNFREGVSNVRLSDFLPAFKHTMLCGILCSMNDFRSGHTVHCLRDATPPYQGSRLHGRQSALQKPADLVEAGQWDSQYFVKTPE